MLTSDKELVYSLKDFLVLLQPGTVALRKTTSCLFTSVFVECKTTTRLNSAYLQYSHKEWILLLCWVCLKYTDCILCRRVRPTPTKRGVLSMMLRPVSRLYFWRFWSMRCTLLFPLLLGSLWPGVVIPVSVSFMGQLGYRIHQLHLWRGVRHPRPANVLDMTLNNLMLKFQ